MKFDLGRVWRFVLTIGLVVAGVASNIGSGGGGDGGGGVVAGVESISITTQPTSQVATDQSAVTFTVQASGSSPTYQWQRSVDGGATWTDIANASSPSHGLVAELAFDGWQYRVVVSNSVNQVVSAAATLTVTSSPPVITQQPVAQAVVAPAVATFSVSASGAQSYQWQTSTDGGSTFVDVDGATTATYSTPATSVADSGKQYNVRVTNARGTATSIAVTLTVNGSGGVGGGGGVPSTCVPADVLPIGMVIHADYAVAVNGTPVNPTAATLTVVGPSTFQARNVFETQVNANLGSALISTRAFSTYDPASRLLTPIGGIVRIVVDPNNFSESTAVVRQPARYPIYALAAGQSETVTAIADATSVTYVNGVAGVPTASTTTNTTTYTFVGMETLTVPAGTFLTCKVLERDEAGSVKTSWLMVGYGTSVRNIAGATVQTLTSVSVNGTPLMRFP